MRLPFLSLMVLLMVAAPVMRVEAEAPIIPFDASGGFIKTWLVCGPFKLYLNEEDKAKGEKPGGFYTDVLSGHGGETAPQIVEGQSETSLGQTAAWKRCLAQDAGVDLDSAIGRDMDVFAYGYSIIQCTRAEACILSIGSNDGIRVWVNGEEVLDKSGPRGFNPDDDLIPVVLKEGENSILVKVQEFGNRWAFCARFLPFDDERVSDQLGLFHIINRDGQPVAKYIQSRSLIDRIFQGTTLQAFPVDNPTQVVWESAWKGEAEMPIGVDVSQFGQYLLRVKTTFIGNAEQTVEIPFSAGKRVDYSLFKEGQTDYQVVLRQNASSSEKWAAGELCTWLKQVSGAEFPLVQEGEEKSEHLILVGLGAKAKQILGGGVSDPEIGDETFTYRNAGPHIIIWGGQQRGTQYGVLSFLEKEMGIRWYTPQVTSVPTKQQYSFHHLYNTESPGIRVRNDFYYEAFDPTWAARNRINGAMTAREQPGGVEAYWSVHTFFPLMPPEEFFGSHPEYYSLIDGVRTHDHAQLCVTNPDVVRILTERLLKVMREQPQYLIYDVSQNDWAGACECDKCQAVAKAEESESGPVIQLVNQIAEQVEKEFPDKFVGTLAYQYTRKPCKTFKPRHNVVVRFCSIECCFAHDFLSCEENKSFVDDLRGWASIAPHLYIWDYVVNFSHYILPYPNFRVLKPNIQLFRENKAIGIMEQAAYQSRGGEFAELRAYVIARLLWNPDADVDEIINDFMYGYYGRSGQYVRAYFDLLHNRLTPQTHIHLGLQADDTLFSDQFIRDAEILFEQAETVADNEDIRRRVEMASLPVLYLKCKRLPEIAREDGTYRRFCEITEREGVTHYAESGASHRDGFYKEMTDVKD